MMDSVELCLIDSPTPADVAAVHDILLRYNARYIGDIKRKPFAFHVFENGRVVGGLTGSTFGKWLEIDFLAVDDEHRKGGIGRTLLERAEQRAKDEGCEHILLSTSDFQGVDYYPKFGFREIFTLPDYPDKVTEHWMVKDL